MSGCALKKKSKEEAQEAALCIFFPQWLSTQRCTHQEAVEEFMHKEAQHANQDIRHVVEKGHIQDDRAVPAGERATIPDKTHQKYDFITKLKGGKN